MSYELTGTITRIFDAMEFESGFKKREFVVKTDDKYPQDVKFEMVKNKNAEKDMTNVLDKYAVGQKVNVSFDIRGNAYNDRFYVNLLCWKINAEESQDSKPAPMSDEQEGDTPF
jgi:single-strand DNA-binding protein